MKLLLCISTLLLIYHSNKSMHIRNSERNIILKFNENYYNKIGHENIDEFKNMVFRELDQKTSNWDAHLNFPDYNKMSNRTNSIGSTHDNHKSYVGEYSSTNRIIKFYISRIQECSIFINDTVTYENMNNINLVEHMILHNNADNIDPKGVYSDDININFFAFNKKLNIFSVYFEPKKKQNNQKSINNFTIDFEYEAANLLKSNFVKDKDVQDNSTTLNNYNAFIWKIINQNFIKNKENITIELYFDLGEDFQRENVELSLNFTKSIIQDEKKSIVKYEWKSSIDPQEVLIIQAKFPLYFENCGYLRINIVMILVGSIFIIFLIGMLYIILSTVFSDNLI